MGVSRATIITFLLKEIEEHQPCSCEVGSELLLADLIPLYKNILHDQVLSVALSIIEEMATLQGH